MRKIGLVLIAVILTVSGFAQKTADIGMWGGSSTYLGDIREAPPLQTFNLNIGAYFRYNFNPRVALRIMFLNGGFAADGFVEDEPFDFKKNVQDLSFMVEINYLKYVLGNRKTPFTPYIFGGFGMMYFPYTLTIVDMQRLANINSAHPLVEGGALVEEAVVAPAIPFGFGLKYSFGERVGIGVEYQMRKLFSDKLDNLNDPLSFNRINSAGVAETIRYTNFWHNNDWPGYLGIYLTYKIYMDTKACPAYDRKYW